MSSSGASSPSIITLTTDFGSRDSFVGQMKGVILSINPAVSLVDLTHEISQYDVHEAAYAIASSFHWFPAGTVHVGVVDPGVGSERRAVVVQSEGHVFVGPDNGIFSFAVRPEVPMRVFQILNPEFIRAKDSATFQGRDVFAPAAAWLSRGVAPEELGPQCDGMMRLRMTEPRIGGGVVVGEVVHIDRFGNAITNISWDHLKDTGGRFVGEVRGMKAPRAAHYRGALVGELHCLVNSSGYVEFFVPEGSASELFRICRGDMATVRAHTAP
ncbi:MAG: S-adenosyl-l-methionine hydroxide adenosyltransferase family protein [Chloroflexota bacterium]